MIDDLPVQNTSVWNWPAEICVNDQFQFAENYWNFAQTVPWQNYKYFQPVHTFSIMQESHEANSLALVMLQLTFELNLGMHKSKFYVPIRRNFFSTHD